MNLQSQLIAARDSLSPSNWRKGAYFFQLKNNTLCMCAHGALQAQVNPVCKNAIANSETPTLAIVAMATAARRATRTAATATWTASAAAGDKYFSPQQIWDQRPDYVKKDYLFDSLNYGNGDAHYLLGMVGLTISFNDAKDTTFEMVKAKFDEAIALANQLGV